MKKLLIFSFGQLHDLSKYILNWCIKRNYWRLANRVILLRARLTKVLSKVPTKQHTDNGALIDIIAEKTSDTKLIAKIETAVNNSPQHPTHFKRKVGK